MKKTKDSPNVIFILIDALRPKNLGCYGYKRETSPNIDFLAKNGVLFENAFSTNNATEKVFVSITAGRHILLKDSRDFILNKEEIKSFLEARGKFLGEILKDNGYKTYCLKEIYGWQKKGFDFFYSAGESAESKGRGFWNSLQKNQKFRDFSRTIAHHFPKKISDEIKARYGRTNGKEATEDAIKIIKNSAEKKEKFFMLVYYNDTHIPYNPKEATGKFRAEEKSKNFFEEIKDRGYNPMLVDFWKGAFSRDSSIADIIARYDSAILYDDCLIGKIIDELKKTNLLKNTLLFIFSDHGESLYEHGIYFDHHGLYDSCMRIPLIISGKGFPKKKKIKSFVQHEDFVPTVLDMAGIPYDSLDFDGKSLLPVLRKKQKTRDSIFMEEGDKSKKRAIRTEKYKYIDASSEEDAFCKYCNKIHGGVIELYDLKKDPLEKENLAEKKRTILASLKKRMEERIKLYKKINEQRRIKNKISGIV
ncbi:MAG: sulfatase [Candidatus Pacearchaeota archaeon]|nr:sulfatase [Candidatus Pacearchaeota archaeon]